MTRDSEVLNTQETATFLGVHVETVRRLARCGEIPSFKVGKDWRFRKDALLRWSEEQQRGRARRGSILVIDDNENVGQDGKRPEKIQEPASAGAKQSR